MKIWIRRYCLGFALIGILEIFLAWYWDKDSLLGYYVAGGALLVLGATFIPWKSLFSSRGTVHHTPKITQAGSSSNMFEGFGGWAQKHGWLIAGILLAIGSLVCFLGAINADEKVTLLVLSGALALAGFFSFLVYRGALQSFFANKKAVAGLWLLISIASAFAFGAYAKEEALGWSDPAWIHIAFAVSLSSAFLTVLYLVDLLEVFLKKMGWLLLQPFVIFGKALAFQYGAFIGMVFWALLLIGGGVTFFSMSKLELFEDIVGLPQAMFDVMKFVIAIGFFLIVFSPLALMWKKKK